MIVLDTNVVSELMRPAPDPGVLGWLDAQARGPARITVVTAAELYLGVALLPRGSRRRALATRVDHLVGVLFGAIPLPFDAAAAVPFAEVVAGRRRAGRPVGDLDAQIAAICLVHGATLATRNVRDFAGTGVDVVDPWTA